MTGRRSLLLVFAGLGATASLVPASLPSRASDLGLPTEALLGAVPALFAGLLVGVLLAPFVAGRRSTAFAVRLGGAGQLLGLLALLFAPTAAVVVVAAGVAGLGFGLVEASGTILARRLAGDELPRLLTLLTAVVGGVAAVAPLLVVFAGLGHVVFLVLAAAAVLHLVTLGLVPATPGADAAARLGPLTRRLVPFAVALFCYVGVESLISGWSAATVQRDLGADAAVSAFGTSAFWALMVAGRLAGNRVLRRGMPAGRLAIGCATAVAVLLVAAALLPGIPALALTGVAVLACGPCYALLVGRSLSGVPSERAASSAATMIACGAIGGTVVPLAAAGAVAASGWIGAGVALAAVAALLAGRAWKAETR